ncbi:hypothetical protein THRCLA_05704 [Thraustotheca clavata]|uniref:LYC1 C-terminal domain-containing protein n=1 Tax=Thraustotheca clavata TaxID=74557 RepID=A0A1V9ZV09_9STRA|nr:hypothetical protein THRCLA_05704 [Thraustotheca clavata]
MNNSMNDSLILVPVTPEQQYEADLHTFDSWGAPHLTLEKYIERENCLRATKFAQETLTGYVLVPRTDPKTKDILAYVEVFRRPSVLFPDNASGIIHEKGFSIGSVYTPVKHRKKGYAATMLARVIEVMQAEAKSYIMSNLYSDIGPMYYASKGWLVHRSDEALIPVAAVIPPSDLAPCPVIYSVDSYVALEHVAKASQQSMEKNLKQGQVYFPLTASCILWFDARSRFFAAHLRGLTSFPTCHGSYKVDARGQVTDQVLWMHDFRGNKLVILHWSVQPAYTWHFLEIAAKEAAKWNLEKIMLWNVEVPDALKQFNGPRDDSLASLMVKKLPEINGNIALEWIGNEKYAWI